MSDAHELDALHKAAPEPIKEIARNLHAALGNALVPGVNDHALEYAERAIAEMLRYLSGPMDYHRIITLYASGDLVPREKVEELVKAGDAMEHILSHSAGANVTVLAWLAARAAVKENS